MLRITQLVLKEVGILVIASRCISVLFCIYFLSTLSASNISRLLYYFYAFNQSSAQLISNYYFLVSKVQMLFAFSLQRSTKVLFLQRKISLEVKQLYFFLSSVLLLQKSSIYTLKNALRPNILPIIKVAPIRSLTLSTQLFFIREKKVFLVLSYSLIRVARFS